MTKSAPPVPPLKLPIATPPKLISKPDTRMALVSARLIQSSANWPDTTMLPETKKPSGSVTVTSGSSSTGPASICGVETSSVAARPARTGGAESSSVMVWTSGVGSSFPAASTAVAVMVQSPRAAPTML